MFITIGILLGLNAIFSLGIVSQDSIRDKFATQDMSMSTANCNLIDVSEHPLESRDKCQRRNGKS